MFLDFVCILFHTAKCYYFNVYESLVMLKTLIHHKSENVIFIINAIVRTHSFLELRKNQMKSNYEFGKNYQANLLLLI